MKGVTKYLVFWYLFNISEHSVSQNLHFAEHTLEDYTKNIVSVNSKSFFLERDGYSCNLIGIDQQANRIFKKTITGPSSGGSVKGPIKVLSTKEKNILALYNGVNDGCDYLQFRNLHMQLVDTLGNTLFTASLLSNTINSIYDDQAYDAVQANDSSYYLSVLNELYHYSKNGNFISKKTLTISSIQCLGFLQNGNLMVNGSYQNNKVNAELDTAGNLLGNPVAGVSLRKFYQDLSGKTYALSQNGSLLRFTAQYAVLAQSSVPGLVYTDFQFLNDTVYATGYYSSNGQPYYAALNQNLVNIYNTSAPLKGIYPSGISLNNQNKVNIVATGHNKFGPFVSVSNPAMSFRNYFQFSKTGTFSVGKDVGVISYKVMDALNINLHDFQMDAEVEIKNFGSHAVNGFYLNSKKYTYSCADTYRKWVDTLLLPGQTVKVRTGWQSLRGDYYFAQIHNQKRWICFYTSVPDSMADSEPANDRFCDSVSVLPTGIETHNSFNNQIQVFPNPFTSAFTIQSEFEMNEIKLFNALGVLVRRESGVGKEGVLELEELEPGIYFVRVETEKGYSGKRLIKQ